MMNDSMEANVAVIGAARIKAARMSLEAASRRVDELLRAHSDKATMDASSKHVVEICVPIKQMIVAIEFLIGSLA